MAANMAEAQVKGTTALGMDEQRGREHTRRNAGYGAAAVGIVALIAGLLFVASVGRDASHSAPGHDFTSQQIMEFDTLTAIPASQLSVTTVSLPVDVREQQLFLDMNTTWMPGWSATTAPSAVTTREQQRFLEENMILPTGGSATNTYMEALTPLPGQDR